MTVVRQRKSSKVKEVGLEPQSQRCAHATGNFAKTFGTSWWTVLCIIIGSIVGVSLGLLCCIYVATLHENDLWFSNIKGTFRQDKERRGEENLDTFT
ncbi:probable C-mannosyltransferase DPY19L3 isoform X2 [Tachysurus ichikawai]